MSEEEAVYLSLQCAALPNLPLKEDQVHKVAHQTQRTVPVQRPMHNPPAPVTGVQGCQAP